MKLLRVRCACLVANCRKFSSTGISVTEISKFHISREARRTHIILDTYTMLLFKLYLRAFHQIDEVVGRSGFRKTRRPAPEDVVPEFHHKAVNEFAIRCRISMILPIRYRFRVVTADLVFVFLWIAVLVLMRNQFSFLHGL